MLKQKYIAALAMNEHVWFSSEGLCMRRTGTTVLVAATAKADVKQGTGAVRRGEELVVPYMIALKGGKGATLAYRVANGTPVAISESMVVVRASPPHRLSCRHIHDAAKRLRLDVASGGPDVASALAQ
jgi:hypothetical protein